MVRLVIVGEKIYEGCSFYETPNENLWSYKVIYENSDCLYSNHFNRGSITLDKLSNYFEIFLVMKSFLF